MVSSRLSMLIAGVLVAVASPQTASLEGVWHSQGYGYAFEIKGLMMKAFEVTATTCLPGFTAQRDATAIAGREATFKTPDGDVFFVRAGGSNDLKLFHGTGLPFRYRAPSDL